MQTKTWMKTGAFLLCGGVFLLIALNLHNDAMLAFDLRVSEALAAARTPFWTTVLRNVSALCAPVVLLAVCLTLMALYHHKHYSIPIAVNLMVSVTFNYALKWTFLRDRPPIALHAVAESGYSFPSGHAMAAGAFYGFLIYIVAQSAWPRWRKRGVITALGVVIAAIGFSRIYLGVHYLTDVIAGFAVSVGYLLIYAGLVGVYLRAGEAEKIVCEGVEKDTRLWASFRHAFEGVAAAFKRERNMLLHFAMMALVTVMGFLFGLSEGEWLVCVVLFGLVIGMELVNTAVEAAVDLTMPRFDPRAKMAKDTAAGAVLAVSVAAAVAGAIIFLPKLWPMLR